LHALSFPERSRTESFCFGLSLSTNHL